MTTYQQVFPDDLIGMRARLWLDGLGGQEDELEDVAEGKLDPPTNTEGPGSVVIRRNPEDIALEKADELDDVVTNDLESFPPSQ